MKDKNECRPGHNVVKLIDSECAIMHEMLPIFHGDPTQLRSLAFEMFGLMKNNDGVGLSANQVGRDVRMFVMRGFKGWGFRDAIVAINPSITGVGGGKKKAIEGCLSYPRKIALVERHNEIEVEYTDLDGDKMRVMMTDMYARIFQHELSHLNGLTMFDDGEELTLEKLAAMVPPEPVEN